MPWTAEGKHVLVTGGSAGIGAALALGFAERGATVGICGRRTDKLAEVLARLQAHAPESRSWVIDLADLDGIDAFATRANEELGGIDVLVNNAGIPKRRRVQDLTPEVVESVMAINYFSPIRLTLALLPTLIDRDGHIVNISSIAARLGPPGEASYGASKAAITAWSESMAVDLPDNDPAMTDAVEALPVEAMVEPVLKALDDGTFEIYVPEYFGQVTIGKFNDANAFLEATMAYARSQDS